jgi:hypothetical protein
MFHQFEFERTDANPTSSCSERQLSNRLECIDAIQAKPLRSELLRGNHLNSEGFKDDALAPAAGIATGVFLSSLLWMIIGFSAHLLLS